LNVDDADSDDDGHAGLGLDSETTWKAGLTFSFVFVLLCLYDDTPHVFSFCLRIYVQYGEIDEQRWA
jgi:hypothetical protein